ncbi:MAG: helix-turn-helix domain-containing protein [Actinomycetota bacterium]|jgi:excisionase family DNA binding protein|nr:helix-turn-helix domain-containing protein [Actinomycetota bacterium]
MSAPSTPAPPPLTAGQLLTADQLSERWQVPKSQVYRLAREGSLPVVQLGRYKRFRAAAIEEFEREGGLAA